MQPINVDGFLAALPSVCTPSVCRALRERADTSIVAMGAHYPPRYRDNDRALLHDPALAEVLWQALRHHLPELAVDAEGRRWTAVGLNPRIRVCRYTGGQAFTRHRDGAWFGDGVRSWLTFQLYLDEGFVGGRTRFWTDPASAVVPRTGSAVVFDHRLWHDGEPVTEGTKHVLRSDVLYRPTDPSPTDDEGHRGYVWRLAPHPDGVLSSGRDGTVRLWSDGRCVRRWSGAVGPLLARGRGWVGGTRDGRWVNDRGATWPGHEGAILDVARFGEGSVSCGADGYVRAWSAGGAPIWSARVHRGWAWRLWVDGASVWTAGDDGVLARTEGGVAAVIHRHDTALTAIGDDVLGDERGRVLDFAGNVLSRHDGRVRAVVRNHGDAVSPVSAGEDDVVRCGQDIVRRHRDFVTDLLSVDGVLGSCSYDGTVVVA